MSINLRLPTLPLWKNWPQQRLVEERDNSPRAFARGFQMKAFTDSERMFPSFKNCFNSAIRVVDIARRGWPVFMGVDLSSPERPGNVIFTGALDPLTQHRYPLEIARGNWTSPELSKRMHATHDRYPNVRCILVETNAYQSALVDWIKEGGTSSATWWWKVESFVTTGTNKSSMMVGLPSLEIEFSKKMWHIPTTEWKQPKHAITCQCGWCVWEQEMNDYPLSATTDTVMGCWFFREAISRWSGVGSAAVKGMVGANFNSR